MSREGSLKLEQTAFMPGIIKSDVKYNSYGRRPVATVFQVK
jgi:hypothetical protein